MAIKAIIGAMAPEMQAILKDILTAAGIPAVNATKNGRTLRPGDAYAADPIHAAGARILRIACEPEAISNAAEVIVIDHRPGDPGYDRPPYEFMEASSIGQVLTFLAGEGLLGRLFGRGSSCDLCATKAGVELAVVDWMDDQDNTEFWIVSEATPGPWWPIPYDIVYAAAADHCLADAYAGRCPDVDPDKIREWACRRLYKE